MKGITGDNLLPACWSCRLDNVVYRLGLGQVPRAWPVRWSATATSRVNGKKVDIPSYSVKVGDVIYPAPHLRREGNVQGAAGGHFRADLPKWLTFDARAT